MTERKTILVVDDDRDMVQTLCDILELHGWQTLRGYDGDEAVALATQNVVHGVVMDVRMPRMSGVEALHAIKRLRPLARTVLMTAYASQELVTKMSGEGGTTVLRKPFELPVLFDLLA